MTAIEEAKEKAEELIDRYFLLHESATDEKGVWIVSAINKGLAKRCALISCDFAKEYITGDLDEAFDKLLFINLIEEQIKEL